MSVTAGAYEGFVAAAELTVQHLHDVLGLDLWMVTCLDALPRPEPLEPLLEEVGGGGADRPAHLERHRAGVGDVLLPGDGLRRDPVRGA